MSERSVKWFLIKGATLNNFFLKLWSRSKKRNELNYMKKYPSFKGKRHQSSYLLLTRNQSIAKKLILKSHSNNKTLVWFHKISVRMLNWVIWTGKIEKPYLDCYFQKWIRASLLLIGVKLILQVRDRAQSDSQTKNQEHLLVNTIMDRLIKTWTKVLEKRQKTMVSIMMKKGMMMITINELYMYKLDNFLLL